jgi:AcrR family transcriptional regulator
MTFDSEPGRPPRARSGTGKTIVAVATRLFVERGYDATTTAQIAEAAEVSPSTFFTYFQTKATSQPYAC